MAADQVAAIAHQEAVQRVAAHQEVVLLEVQEVLGLQVIKDHRNTLFLLNH